MRIVVLLFFLMDFSALAQEPFYAFSKFEFNVPNKKSEDELNFFKWMFETKNQFIQFMDIKPGDHVAEIGAGDGINIAVLGLVFDHVNFVAQDIDAKSLNDKKFQKLIRKNSNRRSTQQTNHFERIIGTATSTQLENGAYDKIIIVNSLHDFDKPDPMLDDIYTKLKSDGKLILLEGLSYIGDTAICLDYGVHPLFMYNALIEKMAGHKFYLEKMKAPYSKAYHYANGFVFTKFKEDSDQFIPKKEEVDLLITSAFKLGNKLDAEDSLFTSQLGKHLFPIINEITQVYPLFEIWIKDIGMKYYLKNQFTASENVLKLNSVLFPESYQSNFYLGIVYQKTGKLKLAEQQFIKSLSLSPGNPICKKKINQMK